MRYLIIENNKVINVVVGEVENGILAAGDLEFASIGDNIKNGKILKSAKPILTYKEKRVMEYPKVEEQLDSLYHVMKSGKLPKDNDFYRSLDAVKKKYPKALNND